MMALRPLVVQPKVSYYPPTLSSREMPQKKVLQFEFNFSRRIAAMGSVVLAVEAIFGQKVAEGFEFSLIAPDQTLEEAKSGIAGHAQGLLDIKGLIESESWGEAQKVLRKSSSNLKLDIYTIIQGKPGSERPLLRKLYSNLFNNATKLDYAARDKDASRVWQCYENMVVALNDILSRI